MEKTDGFKAFEKITKLDDAAGRLGYEIKEVDYFDGAFCDSYEEVGKYLIYLVKQNPEHFKIIEDTVIAICGYGFESLLNRIEEHEDDWYLL